MNNVKYWLDHNFQNYLNKHGFNSVSNEDLKLVLQWFNNPSASRHIKRIYKVSVSDAITLSKKWAKQEIKKEKIKIIRKYNNQIQWVKLVSLEAIQKEGYKMDNCLKVYKPDNEKTLYSLRDNGQSVINVEFIGSLVSQVKGFKNFEVPAQYMDYVLDFLIKNPIQHNFLSSQILIDLGQIYLNNANYDLKHLPSSLNIKESIQIVNNNIIKEIPDNWTIKGNLFLDNCTNLKKIGKNLNVSGYILIRNCPLFEGFDDDDLSVYSLELVDLPRLTKVPKNLNSQMSIRMSNCPSLKEFPDIMYSAREIILYNLSKITHIKNIQANEIKIQDCVNLQNIDFCSASNDLIVVNNENLHYLPGTLYIGRYLKSDRVINPKNKLKDYEHIFVGQGMVLKDNNQWVKYDIIDSKKVEIKSSPLMNIIRNFLPFLTLGNPEKIEVKE